jgi:hypothetical protein
MDVRRNAACVEPESEGTLGVVVGRYSCAFREQELALLQRLGRQQLADWTRLGHRRLPPDRELHIAGVRFGDEWNVVEQNLLGRDDAVWNLARVVGAGRGYFFSGRNMVFMDILRCT